MARKYIAGDVVQCKFPLQEDPFKWTPRPGLILRVDYKGTNPYFMTAKITTTVSNASKYVGWVVSTKSDCKTMGLSDISFIHLENIASLPLHAIARYLGHCHFLNDVLKLCANKAIKF